MVTASSRRQSIKMQPVAELARQLLSPYEREQFSPIAEEPYLAVDLAEVGALKEAENFSHVCETIRRLPCPTIGIGEPPSPTCELSAALDVVVASAKEAVPAIGNICKNPLAAMTLVQQLRYAEGVSIASGLFAESVAYATLQGGREFQDSDLFSSKQKDSRQELAEEATATDSPVIVSREGDRLLLTLNRPQYLNAYSSAMRDALMEGLQLLASDHSLTGATLCGNGPCFSIGGDLREFGTFRDTAHAHAIRSTRNVGLMISELAERIECRVHRACIGSGIELPAFCQHIVATGDTFFQLPEITFGLIPGAGGTVSILRRIGRQRTAFMALSARKINAPTALSWGLIDAIE